MSQKPVLHARGEHGRSLCVAEGRGHPVLYADAQNMATCKTCIKRRKRAGRTRGGTFPRSKTPWIDGIAIDEELPE